MAATEKKSRNLIHEPSALPPAPAELKKFNTHERRLLDRLLSQPVDCVYHDKYSQARTQDELFDGAADGKPVLSQIQQLGAAASSLSAKDEALLFDRYNYARYRVLHTLEQHAGKSLSEQSARELLSWGSYAAQLRSTIIQLNMPLVLSMAKRSRLSGLDFNELISEGNLALIRSAEKFDVSRGFKFSTYACRAILKSFSRVAMKTSRYRGLFPVELNLDLEKSDFYERKRVGVEEDCLDELKHILQANLADLNEVEQTVIRERFALGALSADMGSKTLEQVGGMIGVTKERVRQIQNRALKKIRLALEEQFLAA